MVAEILLVPGNDGDSLKSGAQYVGRGLASAGYKVREQISLCSDTLKLQQAVAAGLRRSNVLVVLGGMGRASGFVTKNVLSQGLGLPLEPHRECLAAIQAYCKKSGEPFDVDDLDLANLPRGARAFPPSFGKIPGCVISSAKQHIVLMPETPSEIAPMFNHHVVPALGGAQSSSTVTRTLRTYGVRDSAVREKLADLMTGANPMVTVQKEGNEVLIRVTAHAASNQQAAALCTPVLRSIVDRMGDSAYGLDVDSLQTAVVQKLERKSLELGIAEAGLGGMLTRLIGETENGSEVLRYSVAAEDEAIKTDKLGLKPKLLKKRGNVSEYAAVALAAAAREKTDVGGVGLGVVANTTDAGNKKCPLGLVYIAVCDEESVYVKKLVVGDGDAAPDTIVDAAVSRALNMLRLFVDYLPDTHPGAIPLEKALHGKRTVTDSASYSDAVEDEEYEAEPERKSGGKVRKLIFTLAMLVFLGSAGYLGKMYYDSWRAAKIATDLQNMFQFGDSISMDEIPENYPDSYLVKFAGLWSANPDVVAYVNISGTTVQYPIVQAADNDHYLRRDYYGKSSQHGIPFMDYRVDVRRPSENMVIYGHNMKDGQIFGELMSYKDFEYYQDHPVVDLATIYEENSYKIFSVFITNAYEAQGPVFAYHDFINAASSEDFMNYVYQVQVRSLFNTTVDVQPGDELITLSSCTYEFTDARMVVVARKVRPGEDAEVNTADARVNPSPLMPDIWYSTFGGTKPLVEEATVVTTPMTNTASAPVTATSLASRPAASSAGGTATNTLSQAMASTSAQLSSQEAEVVVEKAAVDEGPAVQQAEASASSAESAAALASEQEAARIASEQEAARIASEQEASQAAAAAAEAQAAAARLEAEAEAARLASESEAARQASEAAAAEAQRERDIFDDADYWDNYYRDDNDDDDRYRDDDDNYSDDSYDGNYSGSASSPGTIRASVNGSVREIDALELLAQVVQNEVGSSFHTEAIKAQAIATYSYIMYEVDKGQTPAVYATSNVSSKVADAVAQVGGRRLYYNGKPAYTPYHATSAGSTTTSQAVWGGSYPYLVSVDSSIESSLSGYKVATTMSSSQVAERIENRLGISTSGDPSSWFQVLNKVDGGYNGDMSVCGQTKSAKTGSTLTGRLIRETVLNLRSACFTVDYNSGTDTFTFTTYGYGHGVGMPQTGANLYANQGWSHSQILSHYYPGTNIQ